MNTRMKQKIVAIALAGAIAGGIGLVAAQGPAAPGTPAAELQALGGRFGPGSGLRGFPFGSLALGTTVQLTFYDGDPEAGGAELSTLSLTYGEDSEAAFAEDFAEAREDAAYLVAEIGEQTRTVDLANVTLPTDGRGLLPRELRFGRGLSEESVLTATFYDADPEENGQVLQTLSFTYGQDSEAGFANDFAAAAEDAAFVSITTSPQTYTVNLAEAQAFQHGFKGRNRR